MSSSYRGALVVGWFSHSEPIFCLFSVFFIKYPTDENVSGSDSCSTFKGKPLPFAEISLLPFSHFWIYWGESWEGRALHFCTKPKKQHFRSSFSSTEQSCHVEAPLFDSNEWLTFQCWMVPLSRQCRPQLVRRVSNRECWMCWLAYSSNECPASADVRRFFHWGAQDKREKPAPGPSWKLTRGHRLGRFWRVRVYGYTWSSITWWRRCTAAMPPQDKTQFKILSIVLMLMGHAIKA